MILSAIDTENIDKEILNTDEYALDLETKLNHLRIFIQSLDNSNHHRNQSTSSYQTLSYEAPPFISTSCIENQQQSFIATLLSTFSNPTHHLPKLTLPNFSGNILEWQSFWDSFESAVHMNQILPDIQKFYCLKSQLRVEVSHTMLKLLTAAVRDVESGQVTIMARLDSFIETFQCRDCINQVVKEYKIAVKSGSTLGKEKPKASKPEEPIKDHQLSDLSEIEVNDIEEDKTALDDASELLEHLESNTDALVCLGETRFGIKMNAADLSRCEEHSQTAKKFVLLILL